MLVHVIFMCCFFLFFLKMPPRLWGVGGVGGGWAGLVAVEVGLWESTLCRGTSEFQESPQVVGSFRKHPKKRV